MTFRDLAQIGGVVAVLFAAAVLGPSCVLSFPDDELHLEAGTNGGSEAGAGDGSLADASGDQALDAPELPGLAVEQTSTGTAKKDAARTAISHTTSGRCRLMLVGVSFGEDKRDRVAAVTYDGSELTRVGARDHKDKDGARVEIWQLVAPVEGTHEVVVSFNSKKHEGATVGVLTLTGADQTALVAGFSSAQGDSTNPSATVRSAKDNLVFGVAALLDGGSKAFTPAAGQTEHWDLSSDKASGAGSTQAGAASAEIGWSTESKGKWVVGGVSIKPGC